MHLQSLELFGFKSFADKTIFNFHEGVTAVVGPNGCGKSNVLDAVRWVLGEQSAKALRGGEMADVIFNGTDSRKPLGFAEVSLTFSDCSAELGTDWHDVRVTRRVYRDGNSEYFLNKTGCRLKDIHSLFADTGVGRTAYSIMEQGKIDLILSSRPEDRRSIFEEAAGIAKYKAQKKEAMRKLEATEANLLRISDIIKEVKRQIGSLQRQAGKARRYQALHADLQTLDTHFSHRKLQTLERELGECASAIASVSETERETRQQIESGESKLADLRAELDGVDERVTTARGKLQQLESEIASHRSRIEFNEQRASEFNDLIARSEREIASAETKLRQHETEIEAANALVEETARLLLQKKAGLDEATRLASERRAARAVTDEKLRGAQMNLSKDELRLAAMENDLRDLAERKQTTQRDAEAIAHQIASAGAGREQLHAKVQTARDATQSEQQTVEELFALWRTHEDNLRGHQSASADIAKQLAVIDRRIAEKESRHDVLRQLNEEGEGLAQGSQALLKSEQFEFAGALAAQLDVAQEFVPAVEAALGRNLHAIVLRDASRANEIIAHLHAQQLGQAALILGEIEETESEPAKILPAGALGWAADKVNAPAPLKTIVRRLLHDVALFENLESAIDAVSRESGIAAATLRGEFISHDGVLFGGSSKVRTDSLLERKVRIDALALELATLKRERAEIEQRRHQTETQIASANGNLEQARARHQEAHLAQAAAASKITELERAHHSAERDFEILQSEHATLEKQIASADARLAELATQQKELNAQLATQNSEIAKLNETRADALRQEEETAARLAELRITVATENQKHEALLAQRAPMLARRTELTELAASRKADIESYQTRLAAQATETESAKSAIAAQTDQRQQRESEVEQFLAERARQLEAINSHDGELRGARHRLSELQEKRGAHTVRQTELQLHIEHLAEHVTQRYQIDLRVFTPDSFAHEKVLQAQMKRAGESVGGRGGETTDQPRPATTATEEILQQLIADLTRQLDGMGPVNLDAVQEYDELEQRFQFLEAQNTDLINSKRELLDVIARINVTTQKLFAETFAQVRVNFKEMFAELFGGGRADLQLLDENDALNCGIDIIAKPPGKQLQSVSLLSGGERTMTAVALLFAIYMVRPSPFCILDEMDAPLDESNINRFIKMLDRFVQQSQFIIITHNKRTIAKADILYGVTMEERGVSKLVGVRLASEKGSDGELKTKRNGNGTAEFAAERATEPELAIGR
ncbi:MAG: chromosome segregation protein SMC [Verrucomicrobiota bacterium]|nr:chromosome segregation protein SMC [Verrucomicrobiota bacterium]